MRLDKRKIHLRTLAILLSVTFAALNVLVPAAPAWAEETPAVSYATLSELQSFAPTPAASAALAVGVVAIGATEVAQLASQIPSADTAPHVARTVAASSTTMYVGDAYVDSLSHARVVFSSVDRATGDYSELGSALAVLRPDGTMVANATSGGRSTELGQTTPTLAADCTGCDLAGLASGALAGAIVCTGVTAFLGALVCGLGAGLAGLAAGAACEVNACQNSAKPSMVFNQGTCYFFECNLQVAIRNENTQLISLGATTYWYYPTGFKGNIRDGNTANQWTDSQYTAVIPSSSNGGYDTYSWISGTSEPEFVTCTSNLQVSITAQWSTYYFVSTGFIPGAKPFLANCPGFGPII